MSTSIKEEAAVLQMKHQFIGTLIELYRTHVQSAFELSQKMQEQKLERPWITAECNRPECGNSLTVSTEGSKAYGHTHRIRLEIR